MDRSCTYGERRLLHSCPKEQKLFKSIVVWGLWTGLSACSATCGHGVRTQRRACYSKDDIYPKHTDKDLCGGGMRIKRYSCIEKPCNGISTLKKCAMLG